MARKIHTLVAAGLILASLSACSGRRSPAPLSDIERREFASALQDGDPAVVDRLLSAKPALTSTPLESGQTPLQFAVGKGDQELADVIRRHGGK